MLSTDIVKIDKLIAGKTRAPTVFIDLELFLVDRRK